MASHASRRIRALRENVPPLVATAVLPPRRTFLDHIKQNYLVDEVDKSTFPAEKDITESKDQLFKYPVKESYQNKFWFLPPPSFDLQGRTTIYDSQIGCLHRENDKKHQSHLQAPGQLNSFLWASSLILAFYTYSIPRDLDPSVCPPRACG